MKSICCCINVALFGAMPGIFAHILTQEYYIGMMSYAIAIL